MKIQILSDLHTEFGPFEFPNIDRDLLIFGGDIGIGRSAYDIIKQECKKSPVVYILGNHEFYKNDYDEVLAYWQSVKLDNFYFLENGTAIFNKLRLIGAVLWTDLDKGNPDAIENVLMGLNDYQIINKGEMLLDPQDTMESFHSSFKYIKQQLDEKFDGTTIVLTHHLPSAKSVAPQFKGDPVNPGFYSDLDDFILSTQPNYWIHGHTHVSFDYTIGKTRIICNPRGYIPFEMNPEFKPDLIIKI